MTALWAKFDPQLDTIQITIRFNNAIFDVVLSAEKVSNSPQFQNLYRPFYEAAKDGGLDNLANWKSVVDFLDWLLILAKPHFLALAPDDLPRFTLGRIAIPKPTPRLQKLLFPKHYIFFLAVTNEAATFSPPPRDDYCVARPYELPDNLEDEVSRSSVPVFDASEIKASFEDGENATSRTWAPRRVLVRLGLGRRKPCFFKGLVDAAGRDRHLRLNSELTAHMRIHQANLARDLPLVRLVGVVFGKTVEEGTEVRGAVGLLLTHVDQKRTLEDVLQGPVCSEAFVSLVAQQLGSAIRALHNANIIWGAACPVNVLISVGYKVWITGFGGDCTKS